MTIGGACVDGQLTTTLYSSPIPLIGLYIAVGTMVCFFCMSFDLVYGFIRRKAFLPCKLFPMNGFTITILGIATKIPLDLTTSMPRAEDQLSKLTSTALMCTCIVFYMPSLGAMGSSERYGNMAALSVMVITMVVNVCIQMHTGVIFVFIVEHIIIIVCILLLLLLMWSSTARFGSQIEWLKKGTGEFKVQEASLGEDLVKIHVMNYTGNGQTLFCQTSNHHAFGILSGLCFSVVLQAMLRLFALKNMRLNCSGASDYKWSIPIVIVIQFLTIALGTFSIICRWLSFLCHTDHFDFGPIKSSLVELKKLTWRFLTSVRYFYTILLALKVTILIARTFITHILLQYCTGLFFGVPSYMVKKFLVHIIPFDRIFHESTEEEFEKMLTEMSTTNRDVEKSTLSFQPYDSGFCRWIGISAIKDVMRRKREHPTPTHLIQLLSKCQRDSASASSTATIYPPEIEGSSLFVNQLEGLGKTVHWDYRFSCLSVLCLSAIIRQLMPSSDPSKESLMKSLSESFEAIYFVDQKCNHTGSYTDRIRSMAAKEVWAQWNNPNQLLKPIISDYLMNISKGYESGNPNYRQIPRDQISDNEAETLEKYRDYYRQHEDLTAAEFSFLSIFIIDKLTEFELDRDDLWLFFEECLARMLSYMLSRLPEAIIKDIGESNPLELEERRLNKALKFFWTLQSLRDKIGWLWPQVNTIVRVEQMTPTLTPTLFQMPSMTMWFPTLLW